MHFKPVSRLTLRKICLDIEFFVCQHSLYYFHLRYYPKTNFIRCLSMWLLVVCGWAQNWENSWFWLKWDYRASKPLFHDFFQRAWSYTSFFQNLVRNSKICLLTKFYFCFNSKTRKYETWGTAWSHIFFNLILVKIRQILNYQLALALKPLKRPILRFCFSRLSHC